MSQPVDSEESRKDCKQGWARSIPKPTFTILGVPEPSSRGRRLPFGCPHCGMLSSLHLHFCPYRLRGIEPALPFWV